MVLIGFVSSSQSARSSVKSALSNTAVRDAIADEFVKKLEEGDGDVGSEFIYSVARPLIVNAVSDVLGVPAVKDFAGDVAVKMYAVYVEDAPATKIDISYLTETALGAIRLVDISVSKDDDPQLDPMNAEKKQGDPDIKSIRDLAQSGVWLFLILGLLLQIAAWFLSKAGLWKKLQYLGMRLAIGGVILYVALTVAKSRIPQSMSDNEAAAKAITDLVTSPMLTRFLIMTIVGVVAGVAGFVLHGKNASTVKS